MFDRFTDRAKKVMSCSRNEAVDLNHEYIGTEHILLGLVEEGTGVAVNVLKNLDVDLEKVRRDVLGIVKPGPSKVSSRAQLPFTPRSKRLLELSMEEASSLSHNYIGTEHLLLGMMRENGGIAAQVLWDRVPYEEVYDEVCEFLGVDADGAEPRVSLRAEPDSQLGAPSPDATCRRVWTRYYADGRRESEGSYRNRKRQGWWTFWNEDGSVDHTRTGDYEDDRRVGG